MLTLQHLEKVHNDTQVAAAQLSWCGTPLNKPHEQEILREWRLAHLWAKLMV